MTVSAPEALAPPTDLAGKSTRTRVPITPLRVTGRWAVLLGLTVFAFSDTFEAIRAEMAAHTLLTYLPAAAILCLVAAIGVTLRHDAEPPIYDRETDFIVGGAVLLVSLVFAGPLNRRYLPAYLVTHVDVLALLLFLFAGCVLVFGLRPAMRYRWVWLLSLSLFPMPYRVAVISLGNTRLAAGAVMLLLATAATAVAVGRTRRAALIGGLTAACLGATLLAIVWTAAPDARVLVYQWIPAVVGALTTGGIFYVKQRRGTGSLQPFPHRELQPLTAPRVPRAMILLAAVSVVVHLIGAPQVTTDAGVTVPGLDTLPPLIVPTAWQQIESSGVTPSLSNGWHAVRSRQIIEQRVGDPRFDRDARPRRVAVDAIETDTPLTLDIYIPAMQYDASGLRFSSPAKITLAGGVMGILQTMVDDRSNVTYNRLMWRWNNGVYTQQVTLYSVDNHENTAQFPQLLRRRETWQVAEGMLTLLLRGNAVTEDQNPQFKDRELLTECANALIDTQVAAIGVPHE
ncbi:MAG: hypothetical protein WAW85_04885 [Gordonia sp. (in: high G+C Gram-positive bacteria)]|uniref:hypothetical protein n=1 Tax=Gordonia sp. (in: high G+C Gram-positive bacteria) TaxID=84139 RepID=UPI003BB7BD75